MRGLWVTEYTDFDRLTVTDDIVLPPLAPRQMRLRVGAAGVSFATSLIVAGKYQRKPPLPFAPGTECAGEVIECGDEVTRFKPGDRVCAALDWGAMAEEALAWEVNCYPIPDNIDFAEATNFNSYATSGAALTWPHLLNVQPGETLLVHGAAGGIGLAGVEIGKILGATVIATASTAAKRAMATAHGANLTLSITPMAGSAMLSTNSPGGAARMPSSIRWAATCSTNRYAASRWRDGSRRWGSPRAGRRRSRPISCWSRT